jgi:hypothetical protein
MTEAFGFLAGEEVNEEGSLNAGLYDREWFFDIFHCG